MALVSTEASAQFSNCQAIASAFPEARLIRVANDIPRPEHSVEIRYIGHSTFRITAPDGTTIATDYAGSAGAGPTPDVATMNHAHTSHFTNFPDPAIPHVLKGWGENGVPAQHMLQVGEVLVRNVTTDIRSYMGFEANGNSIFIYEIQGLCIGHLGHLHQPLSDAQVAEIGRLDVVFVPVDGTYTMDQSAMMEVVSRLRSSIAIPMHWFGQYTLAEFVNRTRADGLIISMPSDPVLRVSLNTLPERPTFVVLQPTYGGE
ncbi:Zn-dependent hydrolase [Acuticoccus sediminis]|uniref:Zn-dependent hydrolase n=2 Tax=Acuticoccus sediminis TaxID=2184697 RepID=A0A8B2NWK8_9HYPH|nr:Zn-dependent hydrolase [Acuticoccus sediminis]